MGKFTISKPNNSTICVAVSSITIGLPWETDKADVSNNLKHAQLNTNEAIR